ncbi:transposase [Pseudogemmobacter bohemicus]|uniref:transposase n=1 Tax=Pseudogemmobacter bohemicus TaxID=2250708 RepID=UPI000DD47DDE
MSKHNPDARTINCLCEEKGQWEVFTRLPDDGRICLSGNAAGRALRGAALRGKAWFFAVSPRDGGRATLRYTPIVTAKINDTDPQTWLADVRAPARTAPVALEEQGRRYKGIRTTASPDSSSRSDEARSSGISSAGNSEIHDVIQTIVSL